MEHFEFEFDPKYKTVLKLLGITPLTAGVDVDDHRLVVRFGPWRVDTSLTNVESVSISGAFKAHRVIGPHLSLSDFGLTFGTNTSKAICIAFEEKVRGLDPFGILRHSNLWVTVAEPEGLEAVLDALTS